MPFVVLPASAILSDPAKVDATMIVVFLNQSQGGMCISGVLKTTERTP